MVSQLLSEMDGCEPLKQVIVVAATNRPDLLDPAFLRPGRIDRMIYVAPPDERSRKDILSIHFKKMPVGPSVDFGEISGRTEGFSGADLAGLARESGLRAMTREAAQVEACDVEGALQDIRPSITGEMLAFYERFEAGTRIK